MTSGDILTVVSPYLSRISIRARDNIMAICPFHVKPNGLPEQHPSFWMNVGTGIWKCHACKQAGDLRSFFEHAGVSPRAMDTTLAEVLNAATKRLEDLPKLQTLKIVRAEDPVLPEEYLGLWDNCPRALERDGFLEETLRYFDVGYDTRNECITFPLRNYLGKLIGIRGRRGTGAYSRYKTYETPEYRAWGLPPAAPPKTNWLWNYHRVAHSLYAKHDTRIVVVEGYKACMWVHQAGVPDVVALGGSSMSEEQQMLLERLGATLYLFLDNDDSGQRGLRDLVRRLSASTKLLIPTYNTTQPTDLSPDKVLGALDNAATLLQWRRLCLEKTPTPSRV